MRKIISLIAMDNFQLLVKFENGIEKKQEIDLSADTLWHDGK